jgi:CBS-domain-containing membrane protein
MLKWAENDLLTGFLSIIVKPLKYICSTLDACFRPSDRRLSAKLVPVFSDRGCHVFNVTDPYDRILGFIDRSHYFSFT